MQRWWRRNGRDGNALRPKDMELEEEKGGGGLEERRKKYPTYKGRKKEGKERKKEDRKKKRKGRLKFGRRKKFVEAINQKKV